MIIPPRFKPYSGLTIILSQPSRFDIKRSGELFTGNAGLFFSGYCLAEQSSNKITRYHCEIRTADEHDKPLLPETKCLLLLGEKAFREWTPEIWNRDYTLDVQRGCLNESIIPSIPSIASYTPQDCFDVQDYESLYNPLLNPEAAKKTFQSNIPPPGKIKEEEGIDDDSSESDSDTKDHGRTRRSNYRFWLERDTSRAIDISNARSNKVQSPTYSIYPTLSELIKFLENIPDGYELFLDIECDIENQNLFCIGLGSSLDKPIYVLPCFRYDGSLAYTELLRVIAVLAKTLERTKVVIHNSRFDLFVLANRYNIPFGKNIYDTMIAHHKCFVGVEKSLGHAMSHLTWLPYHKNEGIYFPTNPSQEQMLWKYNGKDVFGMMLVYYELEKLAKQDVGLRNSIDCTNTCIYPYLLNTLYGIRYDNEALLKIVHDNDLKMEQIARIIKLLLGQNRFVLPTSNKQCVQYFHDEMHYPIMGRSSRTRKPSLGEKFMYRLKLKLADDGIENPMIDLCIKYRQLRRETGMLGFEPWKK